MLPYLQSCFIFYDIGIFSPIRQADLVEIDRLRVTNPQARLEKTTISRALVLLRESGKPTIRVLRRMDLEYWVIESRINSSPDDREERHETPNGARFPFPRRPTRDHRSFT